ncbi:hypothetical protein KXS11_17970 [Plantibacter flavus]|uniref:hypothetical protein n=1 Tax=Plantibacter flavus TaxID=150123 RepID=UPI003F18CA80
MTTESYPTLTVEIPLATVDDFYAHIAAVERIEDGAAPIALRELGARLLAADPRYTTEIDEHGHLIQATLNTPEGSTDAV